MKELLRDFKDNEIKSEVHAEQDQKKEIRLIGQQRKIRGLTLWEFNSNTKQLIKAKFKNDETLELKSLSISPEQLRKSSRVIINENCIYIQALNEKSARKKVGI